MNWTIEWLPEALEDMRRLDKSLGLHVLKAVQTRLASAPDRYGDPLRADDQTPLVGFRRVRIQALRLVYAAIPEHQAVWIVAVGKRDGEEVYKTASGRIRKMRKQLEVNTQEVDALLRVFLSQRNGGA